MKITVPSKEAEACDICEHTMSSRGLLTKCVVCSRDYCHICEAIMCGCMVQPQVCRKCAEIEGVKLVVQDFAVPITALLKQRDKAMRKQTPKL